MLDIRGASAVITGGASGLGAATARLLADKGMHVAILDVNDSLGEQTAGEVNGVFVHCDVTDAWFMDRRWKRIDFHLEARRRRPSCQPYSNYR